MASSGQGRSPLPSSILQEANLYAPINYGSANGGASKAVLGDDFFFGAGVGGITESTAESVGVGAASGISGAIAGSVGSSAGVGAASGVSAAISSAVGETSSTGTASGVSADIASSVASSAGTGTASGVTSSIALSVAESSGISTAQADAENVGTGATIVEATAESSGASTASGMSGAIAGVVGASSGAAEMLGGAAWYVLSEGSAVGSSDCLADAQTVFAGTIARPTSDTVAGAWLPSTGSDLYAMVDEAVADDADYIYATTNTTCKMALSAVADPLTSSGQVVSYRAWSTTGHGMVAKLMQGATTIATWTHATLPATATTYQQTLSAAECDAITDYTALAIELTAVV